MKKAFYLAPVLATSMLVVGCVESEQMRDNYTSKEDCLLEWTDQQCTENPNTVGGTGVYANRYFGPYFIGGDSYYSRTQVAGFHGSEEFTSARSLTTARGNVVHNNGISDTVTGAALGYMAGKSGSGSSSSFATRGMVSRGGFGGVGMGHSSAS